jgi:hypothetical protein
MGRFVVLLCLSSLAPVAGSTTTDKSVKPGPAALPELPGIAMPIIASEQSLFIPCYAFTPLEPGPRDKWNPRTGSCFLLAQNQALALAAPVDFPATSGRIQLKKLRCWAESGTAGDKIRYTVHFGSLAKIDVTKKPGDKAEDVAKILSKTIDGDHYDLTVSWSVDVPAGDGWLPSDNQFKGCRLDYQVLNLP